MDFPNAILRFARISSVNMAVSKAAPRLEREALQTVLGELEAQNISLGKLVEDDDFARTILHGKANHTYAFKTVGQDGKPAEFILSVSRTPQGAKSYDAVNRLQHHLHANGVRVPEPIGRSGTYPGSEQSYMVTRFIHGVQPRITELTEAQMENLGREVAHAHTQTQHLRPEDFIVPHAEKTTRTLGAHMGRVAKATHLVSDYGRTRNEWPVKDMARAAGEKAWRYVTGKTGKLPTGFVHSDLHPENLIFSGVNNAEVDLLDWGNFKHERPLLHDVINALIRSAKKGTAHAGPVFDPQKAAAFLRGYDSVRPLTSLEVELLPKMLFEKACARSYLEMRQFENGELIAGYDKIMHPSELAGQLHEYRDAAHDMSWIEEGLTARQHRVPPSSPSGVGHRL